MTRIIRTVSRTVTVVEVADVVDSRSIDIERATRYSDHKPVVSITLKQDDDKVLEAWRPMTEMEKALFEAGN